MRSHSDSIGLRHAVMLVLPATVAAWVVAARPSVAVAARPTEGGLFSFDDTDVIENVEDAGGHVRVHYSVEGPNATVLDDIDTDGVPDFPQLVLDTCGEVIDDLESAGFRRPLSEQDVGLDPLGGSPAFDVYLVDFDGYGDGSFQVDACMGDGRCAGHVVIENDFSGYGYDSLQSAVDTLCAHEPFHAVQAAYAFELPVWFSEGTATWAEHWWLPENDDFLGLVEYYLARTDASIHAGPSGPGALFPYGTALFFEYLTIRQGSDAVADLLLAAEAHDPALDDGLAALTAVHEGWGDSLADSFLDFALANLATADLSGPASVYPFSDRLGGVEPEASDTFIQDEERVFPLAATYYRLEDFDDDIGIALVADDDARVEDIRVVLSQVREDASVDVPFAVLEGSELKSCQRFERAGPGPVWITLTQPDAGEGSIPVELCAGAASDFDRCDMQCDPDPDPDDDPDDTDGPDDTDVPDEPGATADPADSASGCDCSASPARPSAVGLSNLGVVTLLGLLILPARRRRRSKV